MYSVPYNHVDTLVVHPYSFSPCQLDYASNFHEYGIAVPCIEVMRDSNCPARYSRGINEDGVITSILLYAKKESK